MKEGMDIYQSDLDAALPITVAMNKLANEMSKKTKRPEEAYVAAMLMLISGISNYNARVSGLPQEYLEEAFAQDLAAMRGLVVLEPTN